MAQAQQKRGPVSAYKQILAGVLDRRPSGTRQRLAAALGKNRSFVSQITKPAYATPIPATHLDLLFEVCHFSAEERRRFMDHYLKAHPRREGLVRESRAPRPLTVYLPDLGDSRRNQRLQGLVAEFVRELSLLIEPQPKMGKHK